jgi:thymidylate synthase
MATEENEIRKTYPQQWRSYNQAQVNEKSQLLSLLYQLCQSIEEPRQVMTRKN